MEIMITHLPDILALPVFKCFQLVEVILGSFAYNKTIYHAKTINEATVGVRLISGKNLPPALMTFIPLANCFH